MVDFLIEYLPWVIVAISSLWFVYYLGREEAFLADRPTYVAKRRRVEGHTTG